MERPVSALDAEAYAYANRVRQMINEWIVKGLPPSWADSKARRRSRLRALKLLEFKPPKDWPDFLEDKGESDEAHGILDALVEIAKVHPERMDAVIQRHRDEVAGRVEKRKMLAAPPARRREETPKRTRSEPAPEESATAEVKRAIPEEEKEPHEREKKFAMTPREVVRLRASTPSPPRETAEAPVETSEKAAELPEVVPAVAAPEKRATPPVELLSEAKKKKASAESFEEVAPPAVASAVEAAVAGVLAGIAAGEKKEAEERPALPEQIKAAVEEAAAVGKFSAPADPLLEHWEGLERSGRLPRPAGR